MLPLGHEYKCPLHFIWIIVSRGIRLVKEYKIIKTTNQCLKIIIEKCTEYFGKNRSSLYKMGSKKEGFPGRDTLVEFWIMNKSHSREWVSEYVA